MLYEATMVRVRVRVRVKGKVRVRRRRAPPRGCYVPGRECYVVMKYVDQLARDRDRDRLHRVRVRVKVRVSLRDRVRVGSMDINPARHRSYAAA